MPMRLSAMAIGIKRDFAALRAEVEDAKKKTMEAESRAEAVQDMYEGARRMCLIEKSHAQKTNRALHAVHVGLDKTIKQLTEDNKNLTEDLALTLAENGRHRKRLAKLADINKNVTSPLHFRLFFLELIAAHQAAGSPSPVGLEFPAYTDRQDIYKTEFLNALPDPKMQEKWDQVNAMFDPLDLITGDNNPFKTWIDGECPPPAPIVISTWKILDRERERGVDPRWAVVPEAVASQPNMVVYTNVEPAIKIEVDSSVDSSSSCGDTEDTGGISVEFQNYCYVIQYVFNAKIPK